MTQGEFIEQALEFFEEIGVENVSDIEQDTDLFESGVLDSLGTLAFLDFLERQQGTDIDIEELDVAAISTLQMAYQFVVAALSRSSLR